MYVPAQNFLVSSSLADLEKCIFVNVEILRYIRQSLYLFMYIIVITDKNA